MFSAKVRTSILWACLAAGGLATTAQAGRLDAIRARGVLTCGVWSEVEGFASVKNGVYRGLEVDVCRAVAAAIFGTASRATYVAAANVRQLQESDEIDLVARRLTWSLTRATGNGLMYGPAVFFDGQGFLVPAAQTIRSARQLAGTKVCVRTAENAATTLREYFTKAGASVSVVAVADDNDAVSAMSAGRCAAYSGDISWLGALRARRPGESYAILPDMISKEPLAPLVRQGDDGFFELVRWTIFALFEAEERGITSENVDRLAAAPGTDTETKRFLGIIPGNGAALGLDEGWARAVVREVGNYGEMFDRNVGAKSLLHLDRGLNRLWKDGGLMFAPRFK